ncbi:MAG: HD domain-containing protein [Eubacterium sp.]|nr:HD domain-containing protein [Eubacterium sp.]
MERNVFKDYASNENNADWERHIERQASLYKRKDDIRSEYERDYTRILHSLAYRRLKHKTQVFFNIDNDHICTRMEHVQHVESVSCTISKFLGLNTDLTRAIAMGHDLGHAPFGHEGEVELTNIRNELGLDAFWHERNSLRMIDKIELLQDNNKNYQNLNLTYAVRDGIISHCGEVDENGIKPRKEKIDLDTFKISGQYQAYTWEGCVVKIADKIAYLGRDIEDAIRMEFIEDSDIKKLMEISRTYGVKTINTTVIIHNFITSICANSTPESGIRLSDEHNEMLNSIKKFNYETIYMNPKFNVYRNYAALIIRSIYDTLMESYDSTDGVNTIYRLLKRKKSYPQLIKNFVKHLLIYSDTPSEIYNDVYSRLYPDTCQDAALEGRLKEEYKNRRIYGLFETELIYAQAIIDYISGMTDRYAIEIFNELIRY